MNERKELLRKEVVHYRADRSSTAVLVKQDFAINLVLWLSMLFLLSAVLVLCFIRYKETETVRGILEPIAGTQKVVSPEPAVVVDIKVSLQEKVEAGQVLATMTVATYDSEGISLRDTQISSLVSEHDFLEAELDLHNSLSAQLLLKSNVSRENWETNIANTELELAIIEEQVSISASTLDSLQQLLHSAGISKAQFDQKQLTHLSLLRQRSEVAQQLERLRQQLQSHSVNHSTLDLNQQITELKLQREKSRFANEIENIDNSEIISVVASQAGFVANIAIESGQAVNAHEPLFYLNPEQNELEAILYVPSRAAGKIAPGQELLLKYDAFDHLEFGRYAASVSEISQASLDPRQHLIPVAGLNEPVFKVKAELEQEFVEGPDIYSLQAGQLLTADFVINDMTMLAYIFSPLLDLQGKVR